MDNEKIISIIAEHLYEAYGQGFTKFVKLNLPTRINWNKRAMNFLSILHDNGLDIIELNQEGK